MQKVHIIVLETSVVHKYNISINSTEITFKNNFSKKNILLGDPFNFLANWPAIAFLREHSQKYI